MFEEHALCLEPHALNNVRCICCHLRSIALRVNGAKIKVNLKRLEIWDRISLLYRLIEWLTAAA